MEEMILNIKTVDGELKENPYLDIHCIGKSPSGEGIIFFFRTENKILYSGVIDACINDSLLKENNIERVDLICWTHPHKDHFDGLEMIIDKYADINTKVLIPSEVSATISKHTDEEEVELIKKIATLNANGVRNKGSVVLGSINKVIEQVKFSDTLNGAVSILNIEAYAPIDGIISKLPYQESVDYNDYSIILVITINGAKFIFTGDAIKSTIKKLKIMNVDMRNIIYVKIPHHGSDSSIEFVDLLDDKPGIAVTTIYKENGFGKTPNKKVIEKYLEKNFKVYTTNKSYYNDKESEEKIGIVSTRIEIPLNDSESDCRWDSNCIKEADEITKENNNIMLII